MSPITPLPRTHGQRLADGLTAFVGSWRFIIGQLLLILFWILLNPPGTRGLYDPFPWVLMNLAMSTQAMFTGPIVMLSQNRQVQVDEQRTIHIEQLAERILLLEQQMTAHDTEMLRLLHCLVEVPA